ncbi:MAG TPA: MBL fold metallo-hydrolase [Gemmatimonadaceae bacterium]|nr:MBL fold metallo-hydrolase [Gemmatimonadaceae bacterium]
MSSSIDRIAVTYIGGPTARLDVAGLRLLTDPTFDAGGVYEGPTSTLTKLAGPALGVAAVGVVDAVLLSHDHHFDNLDRAGRSMLAGMRTVITTPLGAGRIGVGAVGLEAWQSIDLPTPDGGVLRIAGTPARHGPAGGDRGPVTGFVLTRGDPGKAVYVSGDTVWYEGVAEVIRRFDVGIAVLFMGAARVAAAGPAAITMTAEDAVQFACACPSATIVPLHFEDWAHFTEHRDAIQRAFDEAGLGTRLRWPERGGTITVGMDNQTPNE